VERRFIVNVVDKKIMERVVEIHAEKIYFVKDINVKKYVTLEIVLLVMKR
jgi:hypothetical protein